MADIKADLIEEAQLLESRAHFYQFLGRLFYEELTDSFIDSFLATMSTTSLDDDMSECERMLAKGSNKMVKFLERKNADTLTHSKCDYARIMLGAGVVTKVPVAPYESVYANEGRMIMQGARTNVAVLLELEGISLEDSYNMPEDHLAFELQLMAHFLLKQASAAREAEMHGSAVVQDEAFATAAQKATNFFKDHLANWVPVFCEEALDLSRTQFYQGLLECTSAWIQLECQTFGINARDAAKEVAELAKKTHADAAAAANIKKVG